MREKATKSQMTAVQKREVIVRFLVGSRASELQVFVELLLSPVQHLLQGQSASVWL